MENGERKQGSGSVETSSANARAALRRKDSDEDSDDDCPVPEVGSAKPVKGEAFCDCYRTGRETDCCCGEEDSYFEWVWDDETKSVATSLKQDGREVAFHIDYSCGTAAVRGTTPMKEDQYYWEVKMTTPVYGTDMMVGVGTKDIDLNRYRHKFISLIGQDGESWGLSYTGSLQHRSMKHSYATKFGQGAIIGVHLDMWHGTVSFYKNRKPLGLAYRGLQGKVLYPMVCSTAARSGMKIVKCRSFKTSLQFMCCQAMRKAIPPNMDVLKVVGLPPGLRDFLTNNISWLLQPGHRESKGSKRARGKRSYSKHEDSDCEPSCKRSRVQYKISQCDSSWSKKNPSRCTDSSIEDSCSQSSTEDSNSTQSCSKQWLSDCEYSDSNQSYNKQRQSYGKDSKSKLTWSKTSCEDFESKQPTGKNFLSDCENSGHEPSCGSSNHSECDSPDLGSPCSKSSHSKCDSANQGSSCSKSNQSKCDSAVQSSLCSKHSQSECGSADQDSPCSKHSQSKCDSADQGSPCSKSSHSKCDSAGQDAPFSKLCHSNCDSAGQGSPQSKLSHTKCEGADRGSLCSKRSHAECTEPPVDSEPTCSKRLRKDS